MDEKEELYKKQLMTLETMKNAGTYTKNELDGQASEVKECEMEYECASYIHEDYFGRYMFSTEYAAVVHKIAEESIVSCPPEKRNTSDELPIQFDPIQICLDKLGIHFWWDSTHHFQILNFHFHILCNWIRYTKTNKGLLQRAHAPNASFISLKGQNV